MLVEEVRCDGTHFCRRIPELKCAFLDSAVVRHRWTDELAPPTMADAQAAAGALAELGAARVLLYGSVAAGTQRNGSDIDLVAIYDDVDRSEVSRDSLCKQARDAAGCEAEVEVFVTDRPEWSHRTRNVASSFEAHIAPAAIVLFDRPAVPGAVRWRKKISRPADDRSECLAKLAHAARLVAGFGYKLVLLGPPAASQNEDTADRPSDDQTSDTADDRTGGTADESAGVRTLMGLCYDAAMAARLSAGAVVALEGRYPSRRLDVAQLGDTLGAEHQQVAEAARAVNPAEERRWQGLCYSCLEDIIPPHELTLDDEKRKARGLVGPTINLFEAAVAAFDTTGRARRRSLAGTIRNARDDCGMLRARLRDMGLSPAPPPY